MTTKRQSQHMYSLIGIFFNAGACAVKSATGTTIKDGRLEGSIHADFKAMIAKQCRDQKKDPHLNQNAWNNLEKYCRSLAKYNRSVYVCTGPLFLPRMEADGKMYVKYQVIGKNNVAVPTHFFKVVLLEKLSGEIELRPYVMPNHPVDEKIPLERFLVPIESIERASGLLFVPNIMKRTNGLKAVTAGGIA